MNWKEMCEVPIVRIEGIEVPRVLIGSSPFIGAGQFGTRSASYYKTFSNPENIAKILVTAADLGIPAAHIIPAANVLEGVRIAEKETGITFYKSGSTLPDAKASIAELQQLGVEIVFIHGVITDHMNIKTIQKIENQILDKEMIPGAAIHDVLPVLAWLKNHRENLTLKTIMMPFNYSGTFVGNLRKAQKLMKELKMNVFAMKPLAAGILPPEKAFRFVFKTKLINVAIFGVASEVEVQQSITVVKNILKGQKNSKFKPFQTF
ncbi:MAG: hypothetical protein ACE5R6_12490 [Candidatus Heimdallarchaeota archaeon]